MRGRTTYGPKGFTLVEILMVVVILGIAGAVIVPQLNSRDDLKARAAARILMADLIYAQNMAITRQTNHYLQFDAASQRYTLVEGDGMTTITHPISKDPYVMRFGRGGTSGLVEAKLDSVAFVGQSGTTCTAIGFDELGTPLVHTGTESQMMASAAVIVRSGIHRLRVEIESFTGQIRVSELN